MEAMGGGVGRVVGRAQPYKFASGCSIKKCKLDILLKFPKFCNFRFFPEIIEKVKIALCARG